MKVGWIKKSTLPLACALLWAAAQARPVAIGGIMQSSAQDTRLLGGVEMLPVWSLPRLGVAVRNDARDLRLVLGGRELRYAPATGWKVMGFAAGGTLARPEMINGSLFVPLDALRWLGIGLLADTPGLLDFAAPLSAPLTALPPSGTSAPGASGVSGAAPAPSLPDLKPVPTPAPQPAPIQPAPLQPVPVTITPPVPTVTLSPEQAIANLDTVRVSRTLYRTVEVQRVVLELSHVSLHSVVREKTGLTITLPGVSAEGSEQALPSGDHLVISPDETGVAVHLETRGGRSEIFTLPDPYRVVIDTTTYLDSSVPPPVNPDALPEGVTYRNKGVLHLLSFDPARFQARVVTAPLGRSAEVADLVRGAGGVAGVNGGYFDPASSLPVDLVATGGLMTSGSLERRATVGFTAQGDTLFGYPRPRYFLSGTFGSVMVNSVRARPDGSLLTAFVGDGRTRVGAEMLTTLYVQPGASTVASALTGEVVPPAGMLALTFDPARFPQLPRTQGAALTVRLNWQASDAPWASAIDALSAGPLLVRDGKVALNPDREGFNTGASIWRATRQVALANLSGQPTIAYFEYGTPEAFAAALAGAGVRDAVRLDSGSSATAYLVGGYANLGAYLNTVWSRPVPNAIVFVPKVTGARK